MIQHVETEYVECVHADGMKDGKRRCCCIHIIGTKQMSPETCAGCWFRSDDVSKRVEPVRRLTVICSHRGDRVRSTRRRSCSYPRVDVFSCAHPDLADECSIKRSGETDLQNCLNCEHHERLDVE